MSRTIRAAHARWVTPLTPAIAVLLVGAMFASGCATLGGAPQRSGGDGLRAAAKEARREPEEKTHALVGGTPVVAPDVVTCVDVDVATDARRIQPGPAPPAPHRRFLEGWDAGLVAGGDVTGTMLEPGGEFGFTIGRKLSPVDRLAFGFTATPRNFAPGSGFVGAFENPADFTFDLSLRHALTRNDRPLGIAPMIGMTYGSLSWDYHQPVWVNDESGLHPVTSDFLDEFAPYAGVAFTVLETRRMSLDAVVKGGVKLYDDHTLQGLANDAFHTTGFFKVAIETRFPF